MDLSKCQAIVFSEALKRERQCGNRPGTNGLCGHHTRKRAALNAFAKRQEDAGGGEEVPQVQTRELLLARKVIAAARAFLRDPGMRGRFVAVLGDYDDLIGG